jgi:hypothetical protein
MLADAATGEFELVVTWDMARFSRSDAMTTMQELDSLRTTGVGLITTERETPFDWDNQTDVMMAGGLSGGQTRDSGFSCSRGQKQKESTENKGLIVSGGRILHPQISIERSVADRFGQVHFAD